MKQNLFHLCLKKAGEKKEENRTAQNESALIKYSRGLGNEGTWLII